MTIPNIFEPAVPHRFIACVGSNGHIDGVTYASGFFGAAKIILEHIESNGGNGAEMDTLVYPVLYSIRHGMELGIKHLMRSIAVLDGSAFETRDIVIHDLQKLWDTWLGMVPFDRRLIAQIEMLNEIVTRFHLVDSTGQVFRYDRDTDNKRTLEDKSHVDIISVGKIQGIVQEKFTKLFCLIDIIIEERQIGAYTSKFNREELKQLSIELPDYATWNDSEDFVFTKKKWKDQFKIGSNKFSEAIKFIKQHPEFAGNIGIEADLRYLTYAAIVDIVNLHVEYLKWYSPTKEGFVKLSDIQIPDAPMPDFRSLASRLTSEAIGEFCALIVIVRNNDYSEYFEKCRIELTPIDVEEIKIREFRHFFMKANLLTCLASGLQKVGCRSLSTMVISAKDEFEKSKNLRESAHGNIHCD